MRLNIGRDSSRCVLDEGDQLLEEVEAIPVEVEIGQEAEAKEGAEAAETTATAAAATVAVAAVTGGG